MRMIFALCIAAALMCGLAGGIIAGLALAYDAMRPEPDDFDDYDFGRTK